MTAVPPLEPNLLALPPDPQAYRPFPEIATALRSQSMRILADWRRRTLSSMPELVQLTAKEFENDIALILAKMADALESNEPPDLQRLLQAAPLHGFQRFLQNYELTDLFAEERVLRRVIIARVEESLGHQCKPDAAAALHSMIDIMLQQGVIALVQQQKGELRQSSETQLKYLSFLSHDLSNNFLIIGSSLEFIQLRLAALPELKESADVLASAMSIIQRTRQGMREMLNYGKLRGADGTPRAASIKLREVIDPIVSMATSVATTKSMKVKVEIDPELSVYSNADLLTIMLQNLIGNAIKHTAQTTPDGTVRVTASRETGKASRFWNISVTDNGPGIPKDQISRLFLAFQRLPQKGEAAIDSDGGFGLGLAIASEAARLLDTRIDVETQDGQGTRFSFLLPATGDATG